MGIAGGAAVLYAIILVAMATGVYWNLRKKQATLSQMSEGARKRFEVGQYIKPVPA